LYCLISIYLTIKNFKFVLLYLAFVNLFFYVPIEHTFGNGGLTFAMLFDSSPDQDPRLSLLVSRLSGLIFFFVAIGIPIFLLAQLLIYRCQKRKKYDRNLF
jgi:hypothetical protein